MQLRHIVSQFITYAGVAVGTVAHYLLLLFLVEKLHIAAYQGAVAGFLLGAVINYYLNHRITFRSQKRHHEALPKFLIVAAIGVALTASLMAWATEQLHIHYFIAQLVTTARKRSSRNSRPRRTCCPWTKTSVPTRVRLTD